jgi:AcrR family transcriptional regulator
LTTRGKRSQGTVRRRLTRADREKQIVDIATASFSERGYLRTSMDEVAERCGISKPLLYEYFGSKEGLFLAAVEQVQAELDKSVAASLRTAITSTETLTSTMRAYFDFADSTPRFFLLLIREPTSFPAATREAVEATRKGWRDLIAAILHGTLPDLPPEQGAIYAQIVIGGCERLALWRLDHPEMTAEAAARHMTAFVRLGFQSPPAKN